jgi:PhnB protein
MISANTYLNFSGTCEEAFRFYEMTLGGKIIMMHRMSDMPMPCPEGKEKQIAHIRMKIGDDILMGSDSPSQQETKPSGFAVNVGVDTAEEADRIFAALAEGGVTHMPIAETFWAHRFGMCTDRFGTPWMVNCEKPMR